MLPLPSPHDFDEMDYLTSNPGNKEFLTSSIASEPTVTFTPEEFEKYVDDVLKKDGSWRIYLSLPAGI